jgi:oxygen-dependent protoporphyrinogen oxidase
MKVAVVGGGIAGLGAAWRLADGGAEVVLVERNEDAGGRCRTHFWHGAWRIRGAFAFIGSETNLIEQARAIGIYDREARIDLTDDHEQYLLHKRKRVVRQRAFAIKDILASEVIPARQKLALGRVLPKLIAQHARNDPRDPTSAAALDTINACAFFRATSPAFVDYVLEPTMQMFCGYGEEDYSLAWLVWLFAGLEWAHHWWSFAERGVGLLTHALSQALAARGVDVRLATTAHEVRMGRDGVAVEVEGRGRHETISADRAVIAVPGSLVNGLVPGLDEERKRFFAGVSYVGHHIVYYVLDRAADGLPEGRLLPTADGFERAAIVHFRPLGADRTLASGEVKGRWCAATLGRSDGEILDGVWQDFVAVAPGVAGVRFLDRYLQRNDIGLCRREAGSIRRLAAFKALRPLDRVVFAGDYLINSTVGQAHWSGLRAAEAVLAREG